MGNKNKLFVPLWHIVIILCLLFITSCGGKHPNPEPEWEYKPKSIQISISADHMLNEFQGSSHALQLVVYQFDSINKFVELAEYRDGLKKLLKAQNFDPSVQAVKKIFVDPGETKKLILDRAEKAKYVGIVAGYFNLVPGRTTCFFEIPHKIEKKGIIFFQKKVAVITDLKLNIRLKEHDIKGAVLDE